MSAINTTQFILEQAAHSEALSRREALTLLALPLHSDDCYLLMSIEGASVELTQATLPEEQQLIVLQPSTN